MARIRVDARSVAVALVAVLVLAGLGVLALRGNSAGSEEPVGTGASPSSTAPVASATPSNSAPADASARSPFTGRPVAADRPVLAVKIDNVRPARPQTGLDQADIVYVEPVEGGLSRILAIYSAEQPRRIGPVRSARESDLELLAQYGRPGLVYSGANRTVLAAIGRAPVVDLSPGRASGAYRRSSAQSAPHNLLVDARRLPERRIDSARDIGFRFGDRPEGQGTETARRTVRYGAASTTFSWSAKRRRWNVSLDGRAATSVGAGRLAAATVIIQNTRITASDLRDSLGNRTPYTHTVGSGTATVLRDGVAIRARWSRPSAEDGTTFTTAGGEPLLFAAGQVWVVFAER
jgi:hypothetical protein